MKKRYLIITAVFLLVIVTAIVAFVHLKGQRNIQGIELQYQGENISISHERLNRYVFEGELVDGKGERAFHTYRGVLLAELLREENVQLQSIVELSAVSADQYTAIITQEELLATGRVYLAVESDGANILGIDGEPGVQLIVFGDENSRRCVRNMKTIVILT